MEICKNHNYFRGKMKCWKSLKNDKTPIMPYLFDVEII